MALSGIRTCNRPGRSLSWFPSRLQIVTEPRLAGEPRRITGLRVEERGMLRLDPGCSLAFRPVKYVPFEERRKASSTSAEYPRPDLSARFPELESRVIQEIRTLRLHGSAIPRRSVQVHHHPNWGGGSGGGVQFNPTTSTFGKVTTKGGGTGGGERNLQLSLRLYF